MAIFRNLHTDFWKDRFFSTLTPEDKYFYMYLLTNDRCTQCGIYTFVSKFAAVELGYSVETVEALLQRFAEYGKILYDDETGEVMILNWYKYNINLNNRNSRVCINNCLKTVKTKGFVKRLYNLCIGHYSESITFVKELFENVKFDKLDSSINESSCKAVEDEISTDNEEEKYPQCEEEDEVTVEKVKEDGDNLSEKNLEEDLDFNKVVETFEENFHLITPIELEKLRDWGNDITNAVVIKAIEIAALNNKRNVSYLNGILRNWFENGVKNMRDYERLIKCKEDEVKSKKQKDMSKLPQYRELPCERYEDEGEF